ncbi:hypothetical protein FT663_05166 [Candidozyma haemuli var. vulneris]|uniref:Membrane anchor Opy2 N-terminal domain-containing protein n=1 Tax=Candidozyma haemuli TaxID=45357 RepID=A0A2V1APY1_9ASCO|nr:hypothetical protein CXQ85_003650 [[Candida] haemuloni]KAF3985246.1 hypothetical protein FT662_05268 [[Candida] haemuloni var. vulneris]KAF3985782.1 hypothetical protein FT663_05166 [[Candida] haemuloni var. vulneris]PVH19792.1 hypothetical protein CXQ85_003650 [[Candida] haemuloni]
MELKHRFETELTFQRRADGCIDCPSSIDPCPTCPSGQVCHQISRTCDQCPKNVCVENKSSSSGGGTPVGGIVGGVVGGVVVLALLLGGLWYYKKIYRKKHPMLEDDLAMDDYKTDMEDSDTRSPRNTLSSGEMDGAGVAGANGRPVRPQARRTDSNNSLKKNHRVSSYESFMRPQARYARRGGANSARGGRGGRSHAQGRNLSPYGDNDSSKRNSIATTISTTNASNILPVAYIPGVTVRPTKNNTRSIYSYESDSIFSDINTIENASIIAERTGQSKSATMTAIRAQPKLVNVARIDEGDEEEDEEDDDIEDHNDTSWNSNTKDSVITSTQVVNESTNTLDHHSDTDIDSDVDSDIGEINRATSVRRPQGEVVAPPQILIDGDLEQDDHSSAGSFILDIGKGPQQTE